MKSAKFGIGILLIFMSLFLRAQEGENKKIIEDLFLKVWNQKEFHVLDQLPGDTISFHWNNYHFITNKKELKDLIAMWHHSFEDFKFELLHLVEDGNLVAVNLRYTGKHVKDFMGVPALGNNIDVSEMMFFRFEDGLLKEAWEIYDEKGMEGQMKKEN